MSETDLVQALRRGFCGDQIRETGEQFRVPAGETASWWILASDADKGDQGTVEPPAPAPAGRGGRKPKAEPPAPVEPPVEPPAPDDPPAAPDNADGGTKPDWVQE